MAALATDLSLRPLLTVLVSLGAAVLVLSSTRRPNVREAWTLLAALAKFALVLSMLPDVLEGRYPQSTLFALAPGISLSLKADPLGMLFALSASLLWILTSCYSIGYMRTLAEPKQTRYFASFAVCLSATMGIAFAANLLTFVIFYELLTVATYPLVVHKETPEAIAAGRKYLAYLLTAGVALLLAVALTQRVAGTGDFSPGGFLPESAGAEKLWWLFCLFLIGVGTKSALMPLHSWLPSAMIAPTPVSALLHAVAVVKAGVFGFARVVGFVFGPTLVDRIGAASLLAGLAGITILFASLLAMAQDNLKLRLAYSTIGHLSYIVLGMVLSPSGWVGGLYHIVAHAVMKITMFFCAGAIYAQTHRERISELDGIGAQMPLTMGAFALASVGLVGLPPMVGFISKWYLAWGAVESEQPVFLGLLLLSGLLNAAYFFPIVHRAFFRSSNASKTFDEASPWMVVPLLATAAMSLWLGLFPNGGPHLYRLARAVALMVMHGVGR